MQPHDTSGAAGSRDPRLHHHPLASRTVFVAPRRADRPIDDGLGDATHAASAASAAAPCPFCAGHEHLTPPDHLRVSSPEGLWHARIIPNRYPIVEAFDQAEGSLPTSLAVRPAHGVHDVVIESPSHDRSILAIDPRRWQEVWELCRQRLADLSGRRDLAWAMVFKNSGPRAGASLEHVHSQLVALDFVPPAVQDELDQSERFPDAFGELILRAEEEERVVAASRRLVAIVPPATRQPFETWIVPRLDEPRFHETTLESVHELAGLAQSFVRKIERLVPGADYNWWLHQAPFAHARPTPARTSPAQTEFDGFRWHLEMLPRLASFAGFELGAGCHITTMPPVEAAALLREA